MAFDLLLAGFLSAGVCLLHVILGGREIARPLLDVEKMHDVPRYTNYYCWHLVTISIALMAGIFFYASLVRPVPELVFFGTLMSILFSALGFFIPIVKKQKLHHMPQGFLFLPGALLGLWHLVGV